jgi:hypothetical protein
MPPPSGGDLAVWRNQAGRLANSCRVEDIVAALTVALTTVVPAIGGMVVRSFTDGNEISAALERSAWKVTVGAT